MAEQNKTEASPYVRAARQRWPQYAIIGDGPYARACPVTSTVRLYEFRMLALLERSQDCSDECCPTLHRLVRLEPLYQKRPVYLSFWNGDDD
jgi:hypothetical protein